LLLDEPAAIEGLREDAAQRHRVGALVVTELALFCPMQADGAEGPLARRERQHRRGLERVRARELGAALIEGEGGLSRLEPQRLAGARGVRRWDVLARLQAKPTEPQ